MYRVYYKCIFLKEFIESENIDFCENSLKVQYQVDDIDDVIIIFV